MKHKIFINKNNIVELKYVGDISEKDNLQIIKTSFELITELIDHNKKPLVLVDMTDSEHFKPPEINIQAMRDSEAFKMAGFGINNKQDMDTAVELIVRSGAGDHVRIFDTRKEAEDWLLA